MTIDTIDISTFGLLVTKFTGNFNLPVRKKVLSEPEFDVGDQTIEEKVYEIRMFGQYANQTDLATGVNGLRTLFETSLEHDFVLSSRGYIFTGVAHNGFKTRIFRNDVTIVLLVGVSVFTKQTESSSAVDTTDATVIVV